jgi:hypothetical protein
VVVEFVELRFPDVVGLLDGIGCFGVSGYLSFANSHKELETMESYRAVDEIVSYDMDNGLGWILDEMAYRLIAVVDQQTSLLQSFCWGLDPSGTISDAGGTSGMLLFTTYGNTSTNSFAAYDGNGNLVALVLLWTPRI